MSWFAIRKPLPGERRLLLTVLSFVLPLALWCLVSYVPFIWHPDIKLTVAADREGVTTVYTAGDHVARSYFDEYANAVRRENEAVQAGEGTTRSGFSARRNNVKILRAVAPLAIEQGWISENQVTDNAAIFDVWEGLATGRLVSEKPELTPENLAIVQEDWQTLQAHWAEDPEHEMPSDPLLKLIPQGRLSNPVYLPEPHAVLLTGWKDWNAEPAEGRPSLPERYRHSLYIVFSGFFLAALAGVPIGILSGTYDFFSKLFEPFIDFFRYMPAPAFSTLLVAIFLAHDAPKIALVFVGTFFQLVLVVANTTRQLDYSLLEAAQTLGAKRLDLLRRVILPGITPSLYNDLRILLGWAWTWLVIAELIGVKSGLTEVIETQGRWRNFESVFPVIILIGLTGFFTDQLLANLRPLLFPWTPEAIGQKQGPLVRFYRWVTDQQVYVRDDKPTTSDPA
ncbi:MAG: NitT/TauT family transport system permease protein [Puniceicoccaceae bacterium 5H]|nr:MAG: NitT/TauT family transport system permease protein [Puniceicoccaceae bacterium 5H]